MWEMFNITKYKIRLLNDLEKYYYKRGICITPEDDEKFNKFALKELIKDWVSFLLIVIVILIIIFVR
jgi:hypothetical protein